jgi:hypothetical protein
MGTVKRLAKEVEHGLKETLTRLLLYGGQEAVTGGGCDA